MKNFKLKSILILLVGATIAFTSCKKDETTVLQDSTISNDDAFVESIYDNVSDISDEAYYEGSSSLKSGYGKIFLSPCATITLDTTVMPMVLTIDFGEVNCLCNDGLYRRGKIIVTFTGKYFEPGTVITHGFEDYYVNDNNVDGSRVMTNMGPNDEGYPYFTVVVNGIIVLADDGGTITWNASNTRTWIEGYNSRKKSDDVYLIDGEAEGVRASGLSWEKEIINSLRKELSCRWIVSGTVEIRPQDLPVRIVDFGDGECDNQATVTMNGETFTITLNKRFRWRKGKN